MTKMAEDSDQMSRIYITSESFMTHRCRSLSGMSLDMNISLNSGMERAYERVMNPLQGKQAKSAPSHIGYK